MRVLTGVIHPRKVLYMNTNAVTQNQAHRTDIVWAKSNVDKTITVKGHWFTSEYRNLFTGQTIRKSGRMQGRDWFIFDAAGNITGRAHSLTFAKFEAAA